MGFFLSIFSCYFGFHLRFSCYFHFDFFFFFLIIFLYLEELICVKHNSRDFQERLHTSVFMIFLKVVLIVKSQNI